MTSRPSRWRRVRRVVAMLALAGVLAWLGLIAAAEWRHARSAPIVAWSPTAGGLDTRRGDDDRRPVLVLLHGAGLNGQSWAPFVRALGGGFRAIAPDLPGHGARRAERFTLASARATVADVAASVAPAPVILVGDSLGGFGAMAAVDAVPASQLRGVVIAGSTADFDRGQYVRWAFDLPKIALLLALIDDDRFAALALERFGVVGDDARRVLAAGMAVGIVPDAARELMFREFKAPLAAAGVPVLVVNGDGDTRAMAAHADWVASIPGAEGRVFADTGHGVSLLKPAGFAAAVEDFARRHVATATPADAATPVVAATPVSAAAPAAAPAPEDRP
jgi:pimeloyl-ACP methyl ester carboxylesterase